jgi:hypothetical protein
MDANPILARIKSHPKYKPGKFDQDGFYVMPSGGTSSYQISLILKENTLIPTDMI